MAGSFYGAEAIPESWLERLAMHDFIREMADALLNLSQAASKNRFTE
jgi:ADP-ribosylglycohydrolase